MQAQFRGVAAPSEPPRPILVLLLMSMVSHLYFKFFDAEASQPQPHSLVLLVYVIFALLKVETQFF